MSFLNTSRDFRIGFARGFLCSFQVFSPRRPRTYYVRATDVAAWAEVGQLLNNAYTEVAEEVGKAPRKSSARKRNAG